MYKIIFCYKGIIFVIVTYYTNVGRQVLCFCRDKISNLFLCFILGLVHKSQMSKVKVDDPEEVCAVGDRLYCKVINIDVSITSTLMQ